MVSAPTIACFLDLGGPMPDSLAHRHYLETLKPEALQARLEQMEHEHERPVSLEIRPTRFWAQTSAQARSGPPSVSRPPQPAADRAA